MDTVKAIALCHTSIFSETVMATPFANNFKILSMVPYDGKGNPIAHVEVFHALMDFEKVLELTRCQAFPLTLSG